MASRFCPVTVRPPPPRKTAGLPAVTLWAVQVCEVEPPAEVEPIARVQWYSCRWGSAVWHRIVKSGCRLETWQFQQAERLPRALTLSSVLAWRIFYATMLARAVPDVLWSVLWEPDEWPALSCAIHRVSTPPVEPPTLGQAVTWIAQLGGCVGCRRRDRPGAEVMWRGLQHLSDLTTMYGIMRRDFR